ncbi:MAG TPA: MFS transporter [Ktedonobacteraceae bacterium]
MSTTTYRANKSITLLVTCLGSLIVLLDTTIIVTALPTIQESFHANLSDLQWAVDAFTLPFAALMLTGGTLGDRFGRKRVFLCGVILFLLGSTLCGLAPTLGWLLVGRVVQGMGAAALAPGSLSVLAAAFPEPRERAQAIGIWAGVSGLGLAIGPLAGGWLIAIASWPWIFFVNLPIGLLVLALSVPWLAESRNPHARRIDLPGQALATGFLFCLIMGLIEGTSAGWTSPLILALFSGAAVLLVTFLLVEARVHEPMLPLSLFRVRAFWVANVVSVVLGFAMMGTLFFMVQFLQNVQGYSALDAGLRLLPVSAGISLVAPLAGLLTARLGPRLLIVLGALCCASSLLLITSLAPDTSFATLWWQSGLFGVGCGLMLTPLATAVLAATPQERAGLGSSILNTCRTVGISLGIAVLGAFFLQKFPDHLAEQFSRAGLPASTSAALAQKLASAGAGASQAPGSAHLPLPPALLKQAIGQAFVATLHETFLISAGGLLACALLAALFLWQKRGSASTAAAPSSPLQEAQSAGLPL